MSIEKTEEVFKFGEEDLNLGPDDTRYEDGMKCVRAYWAQATRLKTREQGEMIEYLRKHDYAVTSSASRTPINHKLYRATMRALGIFGSEGLSWPIYLILSSIYVKLPRVYVLAILDKFGTSNFEDYTQEYLRATKTSYTIRRTGRILTNKPVAATNADTTLTVDDEDAISGKEEQVAVFDPVGQVKQSVALGAVKRPRALSDNPAIEPKRTRRATDNGGFGINHIVAGVRSSLTIQRFADAAKLASTAVEKPRMTDSDLLKIKEDVKIVKETVMRSEAKLDGFISEMRQFMTAFATTAGIPLPVVVIDESDSDNYE